MALPQNALSPAIMAYVLKGVAIGEVQPFSLANQVHADAPVTYKNVAAQFSKERPGSYIVAMHKDGVRVGEERASTPMEAKLMVLDYVAAQIRIEHLETA